MSQASDSPFAPRRRPTRVAIVGAGFIADFHLEILKETEGVEVAAICDPAAHARNACGDKWGVATRVASVAELKDLDIDVAHVLVPPDLHDRLVREILDLGIGAFVEKPLVLDSKQARELQALADSKGLPLGVNHNNRFHPAFEKLVERVESGEIGRVEHVRVCLSVPLMQLDAQQFSHWMFQAPRNIIFEQAPHPLCQVHRLIGQVKNCQTKILGTRELLPGQVFHDRWLAAAEGEHGTAEIYFAFGQGFTRSTIEVIGSDGSLEADLFHNHCVGERKTLWLDAWNSYLAGRGRAKGYTKDARRVFFHYGKYTLKLGRREDAFFVGMRRSMQAFHEAYSAGQALPVDGAQAAEVLDWCEAVAEGVSGESAPRKPWPDVIDARPGEVAVTGGTGFIGKRVIEQLLERKVPVTLIARRNHSFPPEVNAGVQDGRIRLVRASLEDTEGMTKAFEGVDSVISLATGGGADWETLERSMIGGSRKVAEIAQAQGVRRFVYVSSVAALYTGPEVATLDDSPLADPHPEKRDIYSRAKAAAEKTLLDLQRETGLGVVIARPGIVVGEGTPMQHSGYGLWVRDNHCVAWGQGEHPLPLVLADDVADGLIRAALHQGTDIDGQAINLCAKAPVSAELAVEELRKATGRDLNFHKRSIGFSQTMEIGKWVVKKVARSGAPFPSQYDIKARALHPVFTARIARDVLGWQPCEEREEFLDRAIRIYAPR